MSRVFVSYAHEQAVQDWIRGLVRRLEEGGHSCWWDEQTRAPNDGWILRALDEMQQADFVVLVCTRLYRDRFEGQNLETAGARGVRWEAHHILQELYDAGCVNRRFLPVVPPHTQPFVPDSLRAFQTYRFPEDEPALLAVLRSGRLEERTRFGPLSVLQGRVPVHVPRGLADVLAKIVHDSENAKLIAMRSGFPPEHLPEFRTAIGFWSIIVDRVANGMLDPRGLIGEVVKQFPHNQEVIEYHERIDRESAATSARLDENRSTPASLVPVVEPAHCTSIPPAQEPVHCKIGSGTIASLSVVYVSNEFLGETRRVEVNLAAPAGALLDELLVRGGLPHEITGFRGRFRVVIRYALEFDGVLLERARSLISQGVEAGSSLALVIDAVHQLAREPSETKDGQWTFRGDVGDKKVVNMLRIAAARRLAGKLRGNDS